MRAQLRKVGTAQPVDRECVRGDGVEVLPAERRLLFASLFGRGEGLLFTRKPAYNIDQLAVCGAGGIAKCCEGMFVGKPAQMDELANPLTSVQLQLGWPMGQKDAPQLTLTQKLIELGRRHINQKQDQNPNLDRREMMPAKGRSQMRKELTERMAVHEELDQGFEQAGDENKDPVRRTS